VAAAREVFCRHALGSEPTAGTVDYHNGHIFLCTDEPVEAWSELLTIGAAASFEKAVRHADVGGQPGAAAKWRFQFSLCETPEHAAGQDVLAFPHYLTFCPEMQRMDPEPAPSASAEMDEADVETLSLGLALPSDVKALADRTAAFVARRGYGHAAELQRRHKSNPRYDFLHGTGGEGGVYYRRRVQQLRAELQHVECAGAQLAPDAAAQLLRRVALGPEQDAGGPPGVAAVAAGPLGSRWSLRSKTHVFVGGLGGDCAVAGPVLQDVLLEALAEHGLLREVEVLLCSGLGDDRFAGNVVRCCGRGGGGGGVLSHCGRPWR
jgi:hypothetical protein